MNINEMAPSKFIKSQDLTTPRIATITGIGNENVGTEAAPEMKYTLNFQEADLKPLVLNKINLQLCALACGSEETNNWTGKQIVLWADPTVSFGGKLVGGVRVRPHMPVPAPNPNQVPGAPVGGDDIPW